MPLQRSRTSWFVKPFGPSANRAPGDGYAVALGYALALATGPTGSSTAADGDAVPHALGDEDTTQDALLHCDGDVDTVTHTVGEPLCDDDDEEDSEAEGLIVPDTVSVGEAESDALEQLVAVEQGDTVSDGVRLGVMVEVEDSQELPEGLSVPVMDGVKLGESDGDCDALPDSVTVPEPQAEGEGDDDTDCVGEIVGEPLPLLQPEALIEPLDVSVTEAVEQ